MKTSDKPDQVFETEVSAVDRFERRSPGTIPAVQEDSPNAMLMLAIRNKYEPAFIKEMMDLRDREQDNIAKQAYVKAKAAFKRAAPIVIRDMDNKQYGSKYASETALINTMNPFLAAEGLDISFEFPESATGQAVTCILTHELGHSERVTLSGPMDSSGSKNPLQQVKSTVTYLRKATFEAITGIASSDPSDDDGNGSGPVETLSPDMVTEINDLIKETGANEKLFLKWCNSESVEMIPAKSYPIVKAELDKKKAKLRQPGE